jgi:hypothetical protein
VLTEVVELMAAGMELLILKVETAFAFALMISLLKPNIEIGLFVVPLILGSSSSFEYSHRAFQPLAFK